MWINGSCVEYVKANSYMSGYYYSATTNEYEQVPNNESSTVKYSVKYSDSDWRKRNAVIGYNSSFVQYASVGSVQYKYGNSTVITHTENF